MSSPTATTSSSATTCATSGSRTTCSRGRRRRTTTTSRATSSGRSTSTGYIVERTTLGAFSADDGPHAARPLHRGHVPDLRLHRGARRPVRQLRQPARSRRPDRPALEDRRRSRRCSARRSTSSSTCPRSPSGSREWIEEQDALAPERPQLLARARRRACKPRADHARPRLGRPDPGARATRSARTSGSTSGSTPSIGYLSAAIEWAREPRRAGRLARLVAEPGGAALLLHGQGQHRLPHGHLAAHAARLRRRAASSAPGAAARAAVRRRRERVPDDGGQAVQHEPGRRHLRRRLPRAATTRIRSATS